MVGIPLPDIIWKLEERYHPILFDFGINVLCLIREKVPDIAVL